MSAPDHNGPSPEILARFAAYYRKNPSWGSLHVILDDGNIADIFISSCKDFAIEQGDTEGAFLADELAKMSRTQRLKLEARVNAFMARPTTPERP